MISAGWACDKFYPDEILIEGHGEDEYGKDIVCSGVSSAIFGCLNSLTDLDCFKIKTKSGYCRIKCLRYPGEKNIRALGILMVCLFTIEKEYPQRVHVYRIERD